MNETSHWLSRLSDCGACCTRKSAQIKFGLQTNVRIWMLFFFGSCCCFDIFAIPVKEFTIQHDISLRIQCTLTHNPVYQSGFRGINWIFYSAHKIIKRYKRIRILDQLNTWKSRLKFDKYLLVAKREPTEAAIATQSKSLVKPSKQKARSSSRAGERETNRKERERNTNKWIFSGL